MALRVLLADESATIKKVFQLSLQDYAVDVASVSLGTDVAPVARQFKPDIIFCDVLLQKKNGYDVCAEIKGDSQLKTIPVILMWSGFMEVDEDKVQASRANGRLEKPFDVKDLRGLVQAHVPKTRSQRLGDYLSFPRMPEMVEQGAGGGVSPTSGADWSMESFDPVPEVFPKSEPPAQAAEPREEFEEVPLPPAPQSDELASLLMEDDDREVTQWSAKPINKFQVDLSGADENEVAVEIPDDLDIETPVATAVKSAVKESVAQELTPPKKVPQLSEEEWRALVIKEAKPLIEAAVWKVVPELAAQLIDKELKRLLAEKG